MADLLNFRLSRKANEVAEYLTTTGYFDFAITAGKFALAYALKNHYNDIHPAEYTPPDSDGSNYNIGSLDNDGQLANLLRAVYPDCETPYLYARNLMIFGLLKLGEMIETEGLQSISSLL